jgi:hypothetical protein
VTGTGNHIASDGPDVLYHYTDAAGLLGIVQTGALWVTDAEYLNDAQELQFGRPELRDALMRAADNLCLKGAEDEGPSCSRATIMREAATHLASGGFFLDKPAHAAYVACFCEDGDLLSQWRGYGPLGGFAIGFHRSSLAALQPGVADPPGWIDAIPEEFAAAQPAADPPGWIEAISEELGSDPKPLRLVKVSYGEEAIQPVIEDVLQRVAPEPQKHSGLIGFFRAKTIVLPALATIKHAAFSEEREWRIIEMGSTGVDAVLFRTGLLGVIPYVQLPLPKTAITEIVIGPGQNPELRKRGVKRLLTEQGYSGVTVRGSETPFRG